MSDNTPTPPHPTAPARGERGTAARIEGARIALEHLARSCEATASACGGAGSHPERIAAYRNVVEDCREALHGSYGWMLDLQAALTGSQPTPTGAGEAPPEGWPAWLRRVATDIADGPDGEFAPYLESAAYAMETQARALHSAREEAGRLGRDRIADSDTIRELREELAIYRQRLATASASASEMPALRDQLTARDAELAGVREREWRLRAAGGQLANCAYNLAQRTTLDESARRSLDSCRRQWDAILKRHTVEANHASDAARSGAGQEGPCGH